MLQRDLETQCKLTSTPSDHVLLGWALELHGAKKNKQITRDLLCSHPLYGDHCGKVASTSAWGGDCGETCED